MYEGNSASVWQFLFKRLNIDLPYDPVIPFLGIYPREMTASSIQKLTQKFIAVLFITGNNINIHQQVDG